MNTLSQLEFEQIKNARVVLESESIAMRLVSIAGKPLNELADRLPKQATKAISRKVELSLSKAADWALFSAGGPTSLKGDLWHRVAVTISGGLGGLGGLPTALAEIPLSTILMLRSIGCIAESKGFDLGNPSVKLGCISVLTFGGDPKNSRAEDLGYWVVRKSMAQLVTEAATWTGYGSAPALAKFLVKVGARFGVVVSERVAVRAVPAVGALTGAAINNIFIDHYQKMAHAHFTLESLCLIHGEEAVREAYNRSV